MTAGALGGRFEVRRAIGVGASVALAWDTQLGRPVVLKRLAAGSSTVTRVRALLAAPPHPNLAVIRHDLADGGDRVLVMDHVEGQALADRLAPDAAPVALDQALAWLADVARALDHLHTLEPPVAHGDVKAANVVIAPGSSRAVLVDVGTAEGHPAGDVRALAALAETVVARADATRAQRRRVRRVLRAHARPDDAESAVHLLADVMDGVAPKDRRATRTRVATLTAAVLALALAGASTPTGGRTDGDGPAARPRPGTTAPAVALGPPPALDATSGVDHALTAPPVLSRPLPAPPVDAGGTAAEAVTPAASRLGVYTMGADLGQFDVYHLARGPQPVHQRRNVGLLMAWSHIATLADGWLLFYRSADGAMTTAPVETDGRTGYGDATVIPQAGWTHLVGAGDELVWFYQRDTGAARSIRFVDGWRAADHTHPGIVRPGFDRVVGLGANRILHYASRTGQSVVVTLDNDGSIAGVANLPLPRGWTAVGTTGRGHLLGVDPGGRGTVVWLDAARPEVTHTLDLGTPGWTAAVGFDRGVVLWTPTGTAVIAEIDGAGKVARLTPWSVPPAANLATVSSP